MKIIVLGGGDSPERKISLKSAKAVNEALNEAGYKTVLFDPKDGIEGVLELYEEDDMVFPILHGLGGEDGITQAYLMGRGIPFLGSGAESSSLSFNKHLFKEYLSDRDIPTPIWDVVTKQNYKDSTLYKKPYVLKPVDEGSSLDLVIEREGNQTNFDETIFDKHGEMMIEELIEGDEITIGILGNDALPVVEIIPPQGAVFDFENKYNGATKELCPPKNIEKEVQEKAQRLAEKVHSLSFSKHLSRVDIMIDKDNDLYVLELNTIPGMTDQSLYPKAAKEAGLDMSQLMQKFVEMVKKDS